METNYVQKKMLSTPKSVISAITYLYEKTRDEKLIDLIRNTNSFEDYIETQRKNIGVLK